MFDIDIDIEEIEKINNPTIKNVVYQLKANGFAITSDNKIGRAISKKFPELREDPKTKKPLIIIGKDRRNNDHFISLNTKIPLFNPSRDLERVIKKIMVGFGRSP